MLQCNGMLILKCFKEYLCPFWKKKKKKKAGKVLGSAFESFTSWWHWTYLLSRFSDLYSMAIIKSFSFANTSLQGEKSSGVSPCSQPTSHTHRWLLPPLGAVPIQRCAGSLGKFWGREWLVQNLGESQPYITEYQKAFHQWETDWLGYLQSTPSTPGSAISKGTESQELHSHIENTLVGICSHSTHMEL